MQSKKTKLFIEKARAKHGDRYDYSLAVYAKSKEKVKIICRTHGVFEQTPCGHIRGSGCMICGGSARYTVQQYITAVRKKHGDKYCYSKTRYVTAKEKVIITCRKHGDFLQSAHIHLKGSGCRKCSYVKMGNACKGTLDTFLARVVTVHGGKYDYGKSEYINARENITITCKKHGDFYQTPDNHIRGQGCPLCLWSRDQPTKLYLLSNGASVKVGISIDTQKRIASLGKESPFNIEPLAEWEFKNFTAAYTAEQSIHKQLQEHSAGYKGFSGATEWFEVSPAVAIKEITKVVNNSQQLALI